MATSAASFNRIKSEIRKLETNPPDGITCWPDEHNIRCLLAEMEGPESTPYKGGVFKLEINLGERYPFEPPSTKFLTPIYHPNVDSQGRICLDILKGGYPKGQWKPILNVHAVLTSIQILLTEPNPDDPLEVGIANEFKTNRIIFTQKAALHTQQHAKRECVQVDRLSALLGKSVTGPTLGVLATTTSSPRGSPQSATTPTASSPTHRTISSTAGGLVTTQDNLKLTTQTHAKRSLNISFGPKKAAPSGTAYCIIEARHFKCNLATFTQQPMLLTSEFKPRNNASHQSTEENDVKNETNESQEKAHHSSYPHHHQQAYMNEIGGAGVSIPSTFQGSAHHGHREQQYHHQAPLYNIQHQLQPHQSANGSMMFGQHATPYSQPQQGYYYLPPPVPTSLPSSSANTSSTAPHPVMVLYYPHSHHHHPQTYPYYHHHQHPQYAQLPIQPIPSNRTSIPDWDSYQFPSISSHPSSTSAVPANSLTSSTNPEDAGRHHNAHLDASEIQAAAARVSTKQEKENRKSDGVKPWHGLQTEVSSSSDDSEEDEMDGVGEYDSSDDEDESDSGDGSKKFQCSFKDCAKAFKTGRTRKNHERSHIDPRPFPCPYKNCHLSFRRKPDLQRHVKSCHDKVKNHVCVDCGRSFARSDALKRHREARTKGNLPCIGLKNRRN
ncbi:hypothetical protein SeMB42_g02058 [Synchytrium endobioticum]|uniref:E2 ubiquitin-conjugating enzyme n=1 Tax=Synchytrium endobioticum TaxID=286115 RepID=A0A507DJ73_9FUNG|nr:hypothetical protein SeLEV6574_g01996 [Synchytrium endobioticum]TPX50958.1 hypothetical protein SeMB42_g02058 [Synchytrium endobioticum]